MKPTDYNLSHIFFLFFRRLKLVGSVLSRSELDLFLYIWYHTVQIQNGLSPCDSSHHLVTGVRDKRKPCCYLNAKKNHIQFNQL